MRLDQESSFNSKEFRTLTSKAGLKLQFSGVESHNSIGVGEKYHGALRRVYNKVRDEKPRVDRERALRLSLKACNDTMGPHGLVTMMFFYGVLPAIPVVSSKVPKQRERMKALESARHEMEQIAMESRIIRALSSKVPPASK